MSLVPDENKSVSLREYARRRGVSLQAVQCAIASGRLHVTLDSEGKPKLKPAIADLEWEANTKHEHHPSILHVKFSGKFLMKDWVNQLQMKRKCQTSPKTSPCPTTSLGP